ncbi:MAG: hypothetical protein EOP11_01105 [Proteobacteria bacterium]|nr:MAG: hypothetical protein EOP11_01105 [Pseudomonadota bacterium]
MSRNEAIAVEMLNEIDRARSGSLKLDELEERLWRLLDAVDETFPNILAGRVENLVGELRELQRENIAFAGGRLVDENQGAEVIYNEVCAAIGRYVA